jgi:chromosomal replication initiation ATPase DnaA
LASDTTLIVFGHVCRRTGVSLRDLLSDGRTDPQADARRRAARIFYRLGYGVQQIAYALGRNHSTVCHMLGRLAK